jgi:hypothetical protein
MPKYYEVCGMYAKSLSQLIWGKGFKITLAKIMLNMPASITKLSLPELS